MKKTTEYKLASAIMDYWFKCISKNAVCDFAINDLLESFITNCKVSYDGGDLDRTVLNLTNSQKRKLYQEMLNSGILEK